MFDFSIFKKSLSDFAGKVVDLRTQIENLQRQREDLANAPATRVSVQYADTGFFVPRNFILAATPRSLSTSFETTPFVAASKLNTKVRAISSSWWFRLRSHVLE